MNDESVLSERLLSDTDLIEDFRVKQDSETLERIVARYGALVMGVCRRNTRNQHDADDAFQATFVILVSNISKLRKPESIGSWLFGIAYRVSTRLNKKAARQQESVESQCKAIAIDEDPFELVNAKFVFAKTDEELQRLPEKLKRPMILRYLMGKSNQEIATQLQTSVSAVEGRLKRAKRNLRLRLTRCGITLGSALIAIHKSQQSAVGCLDAKLADSNTLFDRDIIQTEEFPIEITHLVREETAMISSFIGTKSAVGIAASIALITTSVVVTATAANGDGSGKKNFESSADAVQPVLRLAQASSSSKKKTTTTAFETDPTTDPFADNRVRTTSDTDPFADPVKHTNKKNASSKPASSDDPFGSASSATIKRTKQQSQLARIRSRSTKDSFQDMKSYAPSHQRVRSELQERTELDFVDTSLGEVIDFLKQSHNVNIRIDQSTLEAAGISIDTQVQDISISGVTLHEALDLILEEFELTFLPRGNLLFITTPEKANHIHETHVYRLPKLSLPSAALIELITANVTPDLWGGTKGGGRITQLNDRIVVRQTFRGHEELKDLMKQLVQSEAQSSGQQSSGQSSESRSRSRR